jgi:hypothetical protein
LQNPVSITKQMPSMVRDVSAMFVPMTTCASEGSTTELDRFCSKLDGASALGLLDARRGSVY